MSKKLTSKEITQIPKDIQKLFGKPPVLPNENPKVYRKFLLQVAASIPPTEVIGWLLIKDFVDHSWEIIRLRKMSVELVELGLDSIFRIRNTHVTDEVERRVTREWLGESDKGTAMAFVQRLEFYKVVTSLIAVAEACRNATLREIERHSESLASRLRRVSDDIIEGECTEHHPASANDVGMPANASTAPGPMAQAGVMTANADLDKPPSAGSGEVAEASMIPANHDPGKSVSANSGPVKKGISVKKPTKPRVVVSLKPFVMVSEGIGEPSSHGPKKGAA